MKIIRANICPSYYSHRSNVPDSQTQPLQFASIFTDSMVLQQQHDVAVWGKGAPGKKIVVESSWKTGASTIADSTGSWSVS